ncbi:hypothetical protein [Pelosinus sp. IPA-1]|uniref:P-loop ATPase, Sll1717 family n=1 Tax=Pelosinus sp. IPA-1 TaxID=3029569 RepID=UPI002556CAFE|nr:hypothetical protein [Pelosinus sp. IPA-1]
MENKDIKDIKEWLPVFKVSAESDRDLMGYFVKTEYVNAIIGSDRWLLLGRKGTGKTAIFEYLKNVIPSDANGYYTITLNFKDYPWPIHGLYKEKMESELTAYQKSWHYLFIIQAISKLISIKKTTGTLSSELEKVEKLLNYIYGTPSPTAMEVIKSKIARISGLSLPGIDIETLDLGASLGEISFEQVAEDITLKNKLKSNAFNLLDYLEKVLINNMQNEKILIILDQLDESWLPSEIPEYSKILINLINVCRDINTTNKYVNKLKVVPFIRTDIYETLVFNDKNKIYQDSATEIHWDEATLDDMFFERIKKYNPADVSLDYSKKTGCVFEINFVRHGATPLKHMIRRSFLRPRDIIVYMNKVTEIHTKTKSGLFSSDDLYSAEKDFSISMYNELIDEWSSQKPEIRGLLSVLQNIGYQNFNYASFAKAYCEVFPGSDKTKIEDTLTFLFYNSIVGQKINANWEYYCGNLRMTIDLKKDFHVSGALKSRLMLTEGMAESTM